MITYSGVVSVVSIVLAGITIVYLLIALLDPERF